MVRKIVKIQKVILFTVFAIYVISACQISSGMENSQIVNSSSTLNEGSQSGFSLTNTPTLEVVSTKTPTLTPSTTPSLTQTPTLTRTPFSLTNFSFDFRPSEVSAQQYLDQCEYLSNRWGEEKSKPGTIVVPIMYHSVRKSGRPLQDEMQVTQEYFEYTMEYAEKLGFETITTEELIGFLYHNEPIPQYSMILIIDDRRLGVVQEHFMKFLDEYDWTVTLAYITGVASEFEWMEFERLNVNNRLDLQAHGFLHNAETYITEFTPKDVIEQELYAPIPIIEEKTGRRPEAFIWPGGNFTTESVQMAREAGYKVGFTVYSRGPIMYNWIPLGTTEKKVGDPLLVLPRFWSSSATINLENAIEISELAQKFAEENKKKEELWFQNYCSDFLANKNED
jgi:peptidoglycan/xylan/chitin deacetylase (PgdA/CDA1 family)